MAFNFKFLMRCLVAISYAGIYAHQALMVDLMFGLTLVTISYLTALFSFYLFVFIIQFLHDYIPEVGDNVPDLHRECHGVQIVLLALSLTMTFYEIHMQKQTISNDQIAMMIFTDFFIAFPEYLIYLINKILNKKK